MTGRLTLTRAYWFTRHEHGGFPIERAAFGDCDLSVIYIGSGWSWLVRRDGADIAEGTADNLAAAQQAAEAAAHPQWPTA